MWMDVRIYSVTVKNQTVHIWVYVMTTQKGQGRKILRLGPQFFVENLAEGLWFRRERCWGYVSIFVNTLEKLILKFIFLLNVAATLLSDSRKGAVAA